MKLTQAYIRNFRRLEDVSIDFEPSETVFVGPNNSGKTSATEVFRLFLKSNEFSIHDFSVSQIARLDAFGRGDNDESQENADSKGGEALPRIELDMWFSIDPDTEFGRVGLLLPDAEQVYDKVGIRLCYGATDPDKLREDYNSKPTLQATGTPAKPLSHYLTQPGTLKRYFTVEYFSLEEDGEKVNARLLKPEEGKRILNSLVRVECVEAQRKIDDHGHGGSTRLSNVLTTYYKRNLEQAVASDEANQIVDKHNEELTDHYTTVFGELLEVIQGLGVPSVNDRLLRVVSSLIPEVALQGNTTLTYIDTRRNHELPENYNGLAAR
ncbi:recombination protein F [Symmachiella dynata]|uniref:Recombination protein F n=1 Tax=Symmachiella dynata TaxID=2527995 RepID=A0A517ZRW1_9PLAN|nr:AAA family ATPase [Symmachiella dynata]QDU45214.1 recombination protein F [Symmachiella dynata]